MQNTIRWTRHLVVGVVVVLFGLLGYSCSGGTWSPLEVSHRYDQFQSVITPGDGTALQVAETIDYNTHGENRHGVILDIPADFGRAQNIEVSSEDASDEVEITKHPSYTSVKVGDPDVTFNGTARYEVSYTLPSAPTGVGEKLSVDLFGEGGIPIDHVRGVLAGFKLRSTECFYGENFSENECQLVEVEPYVYEVVVDDVAPNQFVTIGGVVDERVPPPEVSIDPPIPNVANSDTDGSARRLLGGLGATLGGSIAAALVFLRMRSSGRNIVAGYGAADAAGAVDGAGAGLSPGGATRLVTDDELSEMVGTEFVPPPGIAPWEGATLITERFNDDTLNAYVSGLAGSGVIEIAPYGSDLSITQGPNYEGAPVDDQRWAYEVLSIANPYITGTYNPRFAQLMKATKAGLWSHIQRRGWWRRGPRKTLVGTTHGCTVAFLAVWVALLAFFVVAFVGAVFSFLGFAGQSWTWILMTGVGALAGGVASAIAYRPLRPSLTAAGSAAALQTASFRRFLHHSEAKHVEWAWEHGLLREYSAWAVALGEADAWSSALQLSSVPPQNHAVAPLTVGFARSSLSRSTTRPSSSGGGGGGGFRGGGSAGGGGGGGSRGGW